MVALSVVVLSCLALAVATDVDQCPGGRTIENLRSDVVLMPCKKLPCKLKKNTRQHITIKFKPDKEIKELKNHVQAEVFGVPLPFVGVDGQSLCGKIENEAGEKVSCPLSAGNTYIYKDSFPIESFYPEIAVRVHWALRSHGKDVTCFEVPAKISS
ncbi:NPC intracellular cholesterol transporter 2 homolog a [Leguminivora glycinivorella]|uniref:NPC intracellular cholesterol transporter 2 homolog a n=1 Tax=Leguminivora glycinivorella TaxID=1035111 RepID=UPI00200BB25C|nr:NPC intracellular cholesterol transporter 2 homolog a [Leguminivora glycinivorella]